MNQTHSVNLSTNHKLINFNVPNYLINNFDNLVKFKRVSRTSMLVRLIETYSREELLLMKKDNELSESFKRIKDKFDKPKTIIKKEEPMIPYSDDVSSEEFWNGRVDYD